MYVFVGRAKWHQVGPWRWKPVLRFVTAAKFGLQFGLSEGDFPTHEEMILALVGLDIFQCSRSVCSLFLTPKDEMFHDFMYVTHWNNPLSGRHPSPPPGDSHAIADLL